MGAFNAVCLLILEITGVICLLILEYLLVWKVFISMGSLVGVGLVLVFGGFNLFGSRIFRF